MIQINIEEIMLVLDVYVLIVPVKELNCVIQVFGFLVGRLVVYWLVNAGLHHIVVLENLAQLESHTLNINIGDVRYMNTIKFKEDMKVFTFKHHQGFITYFDLLTERGWTIADVRTYIDTERLRIETGRRKALKEFNAYNEKMLKCPMCGTTMFLRSVNIDAKTQTGDPKDKSVWMCPNQECLHVIYNEKTVQEIVGV